MKTRVKKTGNRLASDSTIFRLKIFKLFYIHTRISNIIKSHQTCISGICVVDIEMVKYQQTSWQVFFHSDFPEVVGERQKEQMESRRWYLELLLVELLLLQSSMNHQQKIYRKYIKNWLLIESENEIEIEI